MADGSRANGLLLVQFGSIAALESAAVSLDRSFLQLAAAAAVTLSVYAVTPHVAYIAGLSC